MSVNTLISRPADVGHRHQLLLRRRHIVLVVVKRSRLGFELLGLFVDSTSVRLDAGEFAAPLVVSDHRNSLLGAGLVDVTENPTPGFDEAFLRRRFLQLGQAVIDDPGIAGDGTA
eukprot:5464209-Prymnesium_polylepis.1